MADQGGGKAANKKDLTVVSLDKSSLLIGLMGNYLVLPLGSLIKKHPGQESLSSGPELEYY